MKFRVFILLIIIVGSLNAQEQTEHHKPYKNTIRLNLTPTLLFSNNSFALGYERILNDRQSTSLNLGHLALPDLIKNDEGEPYEWNETLKNTGFSFAADYRFYFTERNKHKIPDGLYWGPYVTYYYLYRNNELTLYNGGAFAGTADLEFKCAIGMAGAQLGYQFVIKDRFTVDLILAGPSIGIYSASIKLDTEVTIEPGNDYQQGIYDAIQELLPGLSNLIEFTELNPQGVGTTFGAGYRYLIQIGYRF